MCDNKCIVSDAKEFQIKGNGARKVSNEKGNWTQPKIHFSVVANFMIIFFRLRFRSPFATSSFSLSSVLTIENTEFAWVSGRWQQTMSRVNEQNYYKKHIHKLKFILLHCKYGERERESHRASGYTIATIFVVCRWCHIGTNRQWRRRRICSYPMEQTIHSTLSAHIAHALWSYQTITVAPHSWLIPLTLSLNKIAITIHIRNEHDQTTM